MVDQARTEPRIRRLVTTDGDELIDGAAGVDGQVVRTGRGHDGAALTAADYGTARLAVTDVGFPIAGEGINPAGCVSMFTVLDGPGWVNADGVALSPGSTVLYPPGALRHARDPAGVRSAGTVVPLEVFEAATSDLGRDVDLGTSPTVFEGGPIWDRLAPLAALEMGDGAVEVFMRQIDPDVLIESMAVAAVRRAHQPTTSHRSGSDGDIVRETVAFLDGIDTWIVPVLTLCRSVAVSERRLQIAFRNRLGVSPSSFMRHRALQESHRVLVRADPTTSTVSDVARAVGFWHFGRYSAYYKTVYGEPPSTTLRRRS